MAPPHRALHDEIESVYPANAHHVGGKTTGCTKCVRVCTWITGVLLILGGIVGCVVMYLLMAHAPLWPLWIISYSCFALVMGMAVFFFPLLWCYSDAGHCSRRDCRERCGGRWSNARAKALCMNPLLWLVSLVILFSFVSFCITLAFIYNYKSDGNAKVEMARLGHVAHDRAMVFVHYPRADSAAVQYRAASDSTELTIPTAPVSSVEIPDLLPETAYVYRVTRDGQSVAEGSFLTTPLPGSSAAFSFVFGSCVLGNQMFKGITYPLGKKLRPWQHLLHQNPNFLLFLGDFTYMDLPYTIGINTKDFDIRYRQAMGVTDFAHAGAVVPMYFMFDDHEIADNWDYSTYNGSNDRRCYDHPRCFDETTAFRNGVESFRNHLGGTNPASYAPTDANGKAVHYFTFDFGDTGFFVMDCRSFRDSHHVDAFHPTKTMLGAIQLQRLKDWLMAVNTTRVFKIIASTVPVTLFLPSYSRFYDGWSQFVHERDGILDFIEQNNIHGVLFISGDLHHPFVVEIRKGIFEFQNSPIGAFGPPERAQLDNNIGHDHRVVWYDDSDAIIWTRPLVYLAKMSINTTTRPGVVSVDYYKNSDQDSPRFSIHLVEGVDIR